MRIHKALPVAVFVAFVALSASPAGSATPELPRLPERWPARMQVGLSSQPGDAQRMANTTRFGFRYQYLAGGVNTGNGWRTWNENGHFVTYYIQDSKRHGIAPVFTYYQLQQSLPGAPGDEKQTILQNLQNTSTMQAYYEDLRVFFKRAAAFPKQHVVLHVEPDLWGYVEHAAEQNDAANVSAMVAATGIDRFKGLPNNVSGFARAIVRLRNHIAPNVTLGYHISVWGTKVDIALSDPRDDEVNRLGRKAARFYKSLDADFDLAFGEFDDRDSGYNAQWDGGASWWKPADFRRNRLFLKRFTLVTRKRIAMWQIPLGNRVMRAMNNTPGHYQDNRVEWLLGPNGREHMKQYAKIGVIAFLFGPGATEVTHAGDARGDGKTNPQPINGNKRRSYNADDDGGYFRKRAKNYYRNGTVRLP